MSADTRGIFGPGTEVAKQAAVTRESWKVELSFVWKATKGYGEPG